MIHRQGAFESALAIDASVAITFLHLLPLDARKVIEAILGFGRTLSLTVCRGHVRMRALVFAYIRLTFWTVALIIPAVFLAVLVWMSQTVQTFTFLNEPFIHQAIHSLLLKKALTIFEVIFPSLVSVCLLPVALPDSNPLPMALTIAALAGTIGFWVDVIIVQFLCSYPGFILFSVGFQIGLTLFWIFMRHRLQSPGLGSGGCVQKRAGYALVGCTSLSAQLIVS